MKESAPKTGQLELFEGSRSPARARGEKGGEKKAKLPDASDYTVIGGYAEKRIRKTEKPHICRICGNIIPPGSSAKEIIEVVNGKLMVFSKEYAHLSGRCPPLDREE
jgi:hypothetical protein